MAWPGLTNHFSGKISNDILSICLRLADKLLQFTTDEIMQGPELFNYLNSITIAIIVYT
jgi:hypothetical protein